MQKEIPEGKWQRTVVGGKTAINVGGKVLKYLAKKPFLSEEGQQQAKASMEKDYAEIIFKALAMLKGTALKIGQLLSLEMDIIPPAVRKELEKSYNQVPPLNRALVRKAIFTAFGRSPESVFKSFDTEAFAAASLGQVHYAESFAGEKLAIKIQYPGISHTIKNDMQLVKLILKPLPDSALALPMLEEVEDRLLEEIDYENEAANVKYFHKKLNIDSLVIPPVKEDFCSEFVLTTDFFAGMSLDSWVKTDPDQASRDRIASILNEIFLKSLYELQCIHADPNPGNFIISDDLKVGLVDFGCVKKFDSKFVEDYRQLFRVVESEDEEAYFNLLQKMNLVGGEIDPAAKEEIFKLLYKVGRWVHGFYAEEYFDFAANPDFISRGKKLIQKFFKYKKHFRGNPEFVFLDRTRYGLFRIFELLQAKVKIRNPYECG